MKSKLLRKSVVNSGRRVALPALLLAGLLASQMAAAKGYEAHPQAKALMQTLMDEHEFSAAELRDWFAQAEKKQSILDAIARPAEKTKTWAEYRDIFVTPTRIDKGLQFWRENAATLARAEAEFGVPAQMIVAILGVETLYGQRKGSFRVLDALSTLAFDYPPRSPFFTRELVQFLLLAREQQRDPLVLTGSYAGAMGYGQFMPSSYRAYATDFDDDGFVDIWDNREDAIGSVANYFVRHGWRAGEPVVVPASARDEYDKTVVNTSLKTDQTIGSLAEKGIESQVSLPDSIAAGAMELEGPEGTEYWLGLHNFYVITRYNHSRLYGMAVYQLSEAIRRAYHQAQPEADASVSQRGI